MAYLTKEDIQDSSKGNWSASWVYSDKKIMRYLEVIDDYQTIAKFGGLTLQEQMQFSDDMKAKLRINAIERLVYHLKMIIGNTIFAVRGNDKELLMQFKNNLEYLESIIPKAVIKSWDSKRNTDVIRINEELFTKIFNHLIVIKDEINEPLKRNDLIFIDVQEFNPDEVKNKILNELTETG